MGGGDQIRAEVGPGGCSEGSPVSPHLLGALGKSLTPQEFRFFLCKVGLWGAFSETVHVTCT